MRALPAAVAGGRVDNLRASLHLRDGTDWTRIVAWLLADFRPLGSYAFGGTSYFRWPSENPSVNH